MRGIFDNHFKIEHICTRMHTGDGFIESNPIDLDRVNNIYINKHSFSINYPIIQPFFA